MVPVALSDVIAVGEAPMAAEIEVLARAGFRALLNTQPDGEVEEAAAVGRGPRHSLETAGLTYRHVPIASRRPDAASLQSFAAALETLPRPILRRCYSGARTAAAWALAAAHEQEPDAIVAACAEAGFDIAFLRSKLVEARERPAAPDAVGSAPAMPEPVPSVKANGHANGHADPAKPAPAVPQLTPSILLPRAASAGGFAVAG